jgi:hypothetical protein
MAEFFLQKLKKGSFFSSRLYFRLTAAFPSTEPRHIEHFSLPKIFSMGSTDCYVQLETICKKNLWRQMTSYNCVLEV